MPLHEDSEIISEFRSMPFRPKFSAPINFRAGVVYADAANAQVRQELQFVERSILRKIKALEGCSSVKSIRFV